MRYINSLLLTYYFSIYLQQSQWNLPGIFTSPYWWPD